MQTKKKYVCLGGETEGGFLAQSVAIRKLLSGRNTRDIVLQPDTLILSIRLAVVYVQKREAYDSVCQETEQTTYMRDAA